MIGQKLAHYTILEKLGAGGMGVVYLARDEQLHRTVAIKVLPEGADDVTRARLLHEARAASALNSPHICTVYETGEAEGEAYIAMEYVRGRPLSSIVENEGLPSETVLRYGIQVAEALAHAHEHGILHRDLKASNVVVAADGRVKVLDFGLAKRLPGSAVEGSTVSQLSLTREGTVVGTLPCLAPEVLRGGDSTVRSDIWAFGVLLHELASGQLPFSGQTSFDVTSAILRDPPSPLPAHVPAGLRSVILRCLSKDPADRYGRAGEVRAALEALLSHSQVVSLTATLPARRLPRRVVAAALLGAAALVAGVAWDRLRSGPDAPSIGAGRLALFVSSEGRVFDPAISPDGKMVAYVAEQGEGGGTDLFVGRVAGGGHVRLTQDEAAEGSPAFSPDGERIAFARADRGLPPEICIVPALGGHALCVAQSARNPTWAPDGRRIAFVRVTAGRPDSLVTVNADGSDPRTLLGGDAGLAFLKTPAWSPDGSRIAVGRGTGGIAGEIWLVPSAGGPPSRLTTEPASVFSDEPAFTPDGKSIVHVSNRGGATNLWLAPLTGRTPTRLTIGPGQDESPSVARDGTIGFVSTHWRASLRAHRLGGRTRTLLTHPRFLWSPALSPDGREVVFSQGEFDGSWHLWSIPIEGGAARRLTSGETGEIYPRFSPDGEWLLYTTWAAPRRVGRIPRGGGAPALVATEAGVESAYGDISPDGRFIAFSRTEGKESHVYVEALDGGGRRRLTDSPSTLPRWSPDGTLLAFCPDRSYSGGIFVIGSDGKGERRLSETGGWPVWWPDGRSVAFQAVGPDGTQRIQVAPLSGGPPRVVEEVRFSGLNNPFDISKDGELIVDSDTAHLSDEIWLLEPRL
jgi:Tol biopolymer transport system component/predicted Ser/Thr protein kinase